MPTASLLEYPGSVVLGPTVTRFAAQARRRGPPRPCRSATRGERTAYQPERVGDEISAVAVLRTIPGIGPYRGLLIATEVMPTNPFLARFRQRAVAVLSRSTGRTFVTNEVRGDGPTSAPLDEDSQVIDSSILLDCPIG